MKNLNISAIALAIGLAFSAGAMAEGMPKDQYKATGKSIDADYKTAKAACGALAGNANDICEAEAKGKKSLAHAELDANYKPSAKALYNVRVAKADAEYSVAIQKCDDIAGNDKDVCVKEAKAAKVRGRADAKAQMETTKADAVATDKTVDANAKATEKTNEARKDASAAKHDADYAVAKEKCDVLAGNAKDQCLNDAKLRFGQR